MYKAHFAFCKSVAGPVDIRHALPVASEVCDAKSFASNFESDGR